MPCLDEATVLAFVAGRTADDAVDAHLDSCRACRDLVVHAARASIAPSITASQAITDGGTATATAPAAGGGERYEIRDLLGTGGQALVYLAHDTVLGRDIALKVLRPDAAGGPRILEEARVIARLSHPHIVAIHDAGTTADGAIYLAMEHVAGGSLLTWLAAAPPPPQREVARLCAEVGRALAAAHAAGIVHRDVKPANVLVDGNRRARLGDFGLATAPGDRGGGALAGTPAYMAPEQLDGRATAASDQFSLAVTAWEALTGAPPFLVRSADRRRDAIAAGPGEPRRPLPRKLHAALVRAMALDPARRFAAIDELADALAHDPARARRRAGFAAAAAITLGAAASVAWWRWPAPPARACAGFDRQLTGVWDAPARAELTARFAASPLAFAPAAAARATAALDAYAGAWLTARTAGCEAAQRREESADLAALRAQCLDRRRTALAATVKALTAGDRTAIEHTDELLAGLPALAPCANTTWLLDRVRPPDDAAARAAAAEAERLRSEADAAQRAGRMPDALALVEQASAAAARAGHAPTSAEVEYEHGLILARRGDHAGARTRLERAAELAQRGKDDVIAAEVWIELVNVVGYLGGEHEEALRLAGFAEATIARLGGDDGQQATLDTYRCAVLDQLGRGDEARARCESARRTRETAFGADDPRVASVLIFEARLAVQAGRFADATAAAARAVAIRERALGADHPQLVEALFTAGQVARWQDQLDAAGAAYDRAVAIAVPAFGERSPVVGSLAAEIAALHYERGELAPALTEIDRAIDITEHTAGPEHPQLVFHLTTRGRILDELHRDADALATLERARVIAAAALPPGHLSMAAILEDLAQLQVRNGQRDQARIGLHQAADIVLASGDPQAISNAESLIAKLLGDRDPKLAALRARLAALPQ